MRMRAMRRNTEVKTLRRRSTVLDEAVEELEGVVFTTISGIFLVYLKTKTWFLRII